ncbi:Rotatin [Orchesella cincta]|uniref:Rotatin n=1 Tax=Orchesella cincta TaxID=48709 RepID=A0A1D2MGS6_ORCCI|nr:Rotatin [Orchesella cincta]
MHRVYQEKAEEVANALCGNVFNLATVLCCDAGNNFEDLERVAWTHQSVLFTKLADWLKVSAPVVSRRAALAFSHGFLSILSHRTATEQDANNKVPAHPFLCRNWKDNFTYGQALSENLINILKNSVDYGERMSAMKSLAALFSLSGSSVKYAVDDNGFVDFCVQKLHNLGCKHYDTKSTSVNKKNTSTFLTETLSYMELLSCVFYVSSEAKTLALQNNFPDVLHKIFGWWTCFPDFSLLHTYIEALLNFTEEFPEGALALTLTSNVVGVGPRRVPTQQSIFMEIIGILEKELSNVEHNPNLKTVEYIFELLKNICFVQECRNILLKSSVVLFLKKLHNQETKKWGSKQNTVKTNYLDFLVHASAHSDVQTCITKIPEGLEILVQVMEADTPPASTLALKVLRNLCFQQANKGRLLSENMFMPSLSNKLSQSSDLSEIEHAAVSLWALVANYEKGRLFAKKAYCGESITKALTRVKKMEQTSSADSEEVTRVISLLETVQKLIGTTNPAKQAMHSRSSSLSQV